MDGDLDATAEPGEMFIDRVVEDLENAVVQTTLIRIPDVHPWPLADGLKSFEFVDLGGIILLLGGDLGFVLRRIDWRIGHGAAKGSEITVAETRNFSKKLAPQIICN